MNEASKPLTAFTVSPLSFQECDQMSFGPTNTPAMFQRLIESCLGELHLKWCLIYLVDITVYSKTPKDQLLCVRAVL